jgi:hypothetical protein
LPVKVSLSTLKSQKISPGVTNLRVVSERGYHRKRALWVGCGGQIRNSVRIPVDHPSGEAMLPQRSPPQAPRLDLSGLQDGRPAMENIRAAKAQGRGFILRHYPVNSRMTILTLNPTGNQ